MTDKKLESLLVIDPHLYKVEKYVLKEVVNNTRNNIGNEEKWWTKNLVSMWDLHKYWIKQYWYCLILAKNQKAELKYLTQIHAR